jgi:hypothetical protein
VRFKNIVALLTAAALSLPPLAAQGMSSGPNSGKPPASASSGEMVADLRVIVLQGEDAINSIQTREGTPPVVEVRDRNDRPVDGANVVFELPRAGAGGSFPGQQLTFSGQTNRQGQVGVPAFVPNRESGRFSINVAATHGSSMGSARIRQTNSPRAMSTETSPAHKSGKWKLLAIVAAGAAAGGVILATRKSSAATPPSVTLSPGTVTIGAPK